MIDINNDSKAKELQEVDLSNELPALKDILENLDFKNEDENENKMILIANQYDKKFFEQMISVIADPEEKFLTET